MGQLAGKHGTLDSFGRHNENGIVPCHSADYLGHPSPIEGRGDNVGAPWRRAYHNQVARAGEIRNPLAQNAA